MNQTPVKRNSFPLHKDAILDLAFSPDGRVLASAGYDMKIRLTPLTPAAQPSARTLKEHSDAVYAVAFSPDGTRLASCSADRAVKVWDVATGKLLYTLGDATDWLYTLAWSPDGKQLAAGGVDKSIRIYAIGATAPRSCIRCSRTRPRCKSSSTRGTVKRSTRWARIVSSKPGTPRGWWKQEPTIACRKPACAWPRGLANWRWGAYDGVTQIRCRQGHVQGVSVLVDPFPTVLVAPNGSPGTGQVVTLPVSIVGKLAKAGDVAFYRFRVSKGQRLGVQLITKEIKSKIEPYLQLTDEHGRVLAVATKDILGYTFPEAGVYAVGVRDQEFRGGADIIIVCTWAQSRW